MAIIDITINGNASGGTGAIDSVSRSLDGLLGSAGKAAAGLSIGLVAGIGAVTAAIGGALALTQNWANTLDNLGDVLGTNARESAALAVAITNVGGNVEGISQQLTFLARGLTTAKGELGPVGLELKELGINAFEASGMVTKFTTTLKPKEIAALEKELAHAIHRLGEMNAIYAEVKKPTLAQTFALQDQRDKVAELSKALAAGSVVISQTFGGALKDSSKILEEVAQVFAKMPDGIEKSALMTRVFGRSGRDLSDTLNELANGGLARADAQAVAFGLTLSDNTVRASKAAERSMAQLGLIVKGLANTIGTFALPIIVPALQAITAGFLRFSQSVAPLLADIGTKLNTVFSRIGEVLSSGNISGAIAELVSALSEMVGISKTVGDAIGNTLGQAFDTVRASAIAFEKYGIGGVLTVLRVAPPIVLAVKDSLAFLGSAFNTLFDAMQAFKKFGVGGFMTILGFTPAQVVAAKNFVAGISDALNGLLSGIGSGDASGGIGSFVGSIGSAIESGLVPLVESLAAQLSSWVLKAIPPLKANLAKFASAILASLPALGASIGVMAGKLLGWVIAAVAPLADAFISWIGTDVLPNLPAALATIGTALLNFLSGIGAAIAPEIEKISKRFSAWVADAIPPLLANLGTLAANLLSWVATQLPIWTANLLAFGAAIGDAILKALPVVATNLGALAASIGKWINENSIADKFAAWGTQVWDWIKTVAIPAVSAKIAELADAISEWVKGPGKAVLEGIGGNIADLILGGLGAGKAVDEEIAVGVKSWIPGFVKAVNSLSGALGDALETVIRGAIVRAAGRIGASGELQKAINDALQVKITPAVSEVDIIAKANVVRDDSGVIAAMNNTAAQLPAALGNISAAITTWLNTSSAALIQSIKANITDPFSNWIGEVVLHYTVELPQILGAISTWLVTAATTLPLAIQTNIADPFINWITDIVLRLPIELQKVTDTIGLWLTSTSVALPVEIQTNIGDPFVSWIGGVVIRLDTELNSITTKIKTWIGTQLAGIGAEAQKIGYSLLDGIKGGILARVESAIAAINAAIQRIMEAIRTASGFGSPSRLTIPIGASLMEGIAVGVAGSVSASVSALKTAMTTVMQTASLPTFSQSVVTNPIAPASNVDAIIKETNDILARAKQAAHDAIDFEAMGQDLMYRLAQGITSNTALAVAAMKKAMGDIGDAKGQRYVDAFNDPYNTSHDPYAANSDDPKYKPPKAPPEPRERGRAGDNRNAWMPAADNITSPFKTNGAQPVINNSAPVFNIHATINNGMDAEALAYQVASIVYRHNN